jgi:hypothetical protein
MMGRLDHDQEQFFYSFRLDEAVPNDHPAPDEIDWSLPQRQTRAVAEFLSAVEDDDPRADPKADMSGSSAKRAEQEN